MSAETHVYLDFDNTLSDLAAFGPRYVSALAIRLASELGGAPVAWAPAVQQELAESVLRYEARFVGNPLAGYRAWVDEERARVAAHVLLAMGASQPGAEDAAQFALRIQLDALADCDCALPGAVDALTALRTTGVPVHMASSWDSAFLCGALTGTSLLGFVDPLFGPDLVDCAKEGPEFYRRILEACNIRPSQAIVVDDQPTSLDWAEEAGARVVQACLTPHTLEPAFPFVLRSLVDLPELVRMGVV